jgi:CheY-like chemotaxis protein
VAVVVQAGQAPEGGQLRARDEERVGGQQHAGQVPPFGTGVQVVDQMCDFLANAGFAVVQAGDGSELPAAARSFRPDLIVLDGVQATRQLRGDADLGAVPVILVSATARTARRAACPRAGVDVFLAKPVSLEALRTHIGELLGLQWLAPTAGAN